MATAWTAVACAGLMACSNGAPDPPPSAGAPSEPPAPTETTPPPAGEAETESAADETGPTGIRLVALREHELLGSEVQALEALAAHLRQARLGGVDADAPTERETEVAARWLAGSPPPRLPEEWSARRAVIVLRWNTPRETRHGRRVSRGVGSTLTLRPPSLSPVFEERVEGAPGRGLRTGAIDAWGALFLPLVRDEVTP